jgi:thiol-disulfide isomerase/thioredoxin
MILLLNISLIFQLVFPTVFIENKKSNYKKHTIGLNLGNQAPEIILKSTLGKEIKLSSLRGKIVLIDFWASWCGPCRKENPNLVRAYKEFGNKKMKSGEGFTIYSISLDSNLDAWKKGIEKDGLIWENHVSDLGGWANSAANDYRIASIPSNFLINGEGIIINKNLNGENLIKALQNLKLAE